MKLGRVLTFQKAVLPRTTLFFFSLSNMRSFFPLPRHNCENMYTKDSTFTRRKDRAEEVTYTSYFKVQEGGWTTSQSHTCQNYLRSIL